VQNVFNDGNTTSIVSISLSCAVGAVTNSPQNVTGSGPATFTVTDVPADGTTCTASDDTALSGYTESDNCSGVVLTANGSATCTITNTLNTATITVTKTYSDSSTAAVSAGGLHTCALTTVGGVKCWGTNDFGQLGDGTFTSRTTPVDVPGLASGVAAVSAGYFHTCALTTAGGVKCWGANASGQLGDGTIYDRRTPVGVSGLSSGVAAISLGLDHTCALTTVGGLKCWGYNDSGQLGDGTNTHRAAPVDVSGLTSGVAGVSAGGFHTCALTMAGGVKCWGYNFYGQLGDGATTNRATPVDVSGLSSGVAAVSAGQYHTCVLTTAGGVKCWGWNVHGQLGDGTFGDPACNCRNTAVDVSSLSSGGGAAVSAGYFHTCALTTAGGVKCWGDNSVGGLGDGTTTTHTTPVDVLGLSNGTATVSAGGFHTCVLTTAGGLKCWGANSQGQLGDGTTTGPQLCNGSPCSTTPVDVSGLPSGVIAGITLSCTGAGAITPSPTQSLTGNGSTIFTVTGFSLGSSCSATESTVPSGYVQTSNDCTAINLPLSAGGSPSCTITNTLNTAAFTVTKVYSDGNTTAVVSIGLSCANGTVTNSPQNLTGGGTLTFHVSGDAPPDSCTASESGVPAGYTSDSPCSGTITGAPAGGGSCSITNTLNTAISTVTKVFSDGNTITAVSVNLTCANGTVTDSPQSVTGSGSATFHIKGDTPPGSCTAAEKVPTGYTGSGSPAGACLGTITGAPSGSSSCTITDTPTGRHDVGVAGQGLGFNAPTTVKAGHATAIHIRLQNFGSVTETQIGYRVAATCSGTCTGTISLSAGCSGSVGPVAPGATFVVEANCTATPTTTGDVWLLTLMVIHGGADGGPPCTTNDGAIDVNNTNNIGVTKVTVT
jgi:alpha-tubulin suppressor-like RCC1 family protein